MNGEQIFLDTLRATTLSHIQQDEWDAVCKQVELAGGVRNVGGHARTVIVQGVEKAKSFGGDRSQAGRYAAMIRWMRQGKGDGKGGGGKLFPTMPIPTRDAMNRNPKPAGPRDTVRGPYKGGPAKVGDFKTMGERKPMGTGDLEALLGRAQWELDKLNRADRGPRSKEEQESIDAWRKDLEEEIARYKEEMRSRRGEGKTLGEAKPTSTKSTADSVDEETKTRIKGASISELSRMATKDMRRSGQKIPRGAVPYLDAMESLESIKDDYFMDSGRSVVAYALSNLTSYKGPLARAIKAELKRRLKEA
jgi:hypothetical protein